MYAASTNNYTDLTNMTNLISLLADQMQNATDSKELCDVPFCKSVYTGTISETMSGLKCQPWSSQNPHQHSVGVMVQEFPDKDVKSASDYCRNPNNDPNGPWCYTTDPYKRAESCFVPEFSGGLQTTELYTIAVEIQQYMYPFLLILGTFFNILSISVFTRPSLKNTTTAFLLITLAVFDTLALYTGVLFRWLNVLRPYIRLIYSVNCISILAI